MASGPSLSDILPPLPNAPSKYEEAAFLENEELKNVERKYGATIFAMRIRLVELFQDFDPMRSGLMTESRFVRCVAASLERGKGTQLTKQELDILIKEYGVPESKKVRWRDFVNKIDRVFGTKVSATGEIEYFDSSESMAIPYRRPVSPASEERLKEIIQRLKAFGKHHGADPKSWFYDFDKNNKGWVNYNQFRRGMPQNLISPKEEDLLLARYGDAGSETVNYFKLHTDVTRKAPRVQVAPQHLVAKASKPENEEYLPIGTEEVLHTNHYGSKTVPIDNLVEDKIKQYVYKNRIRLIDFWRDYDRHNHGFNTQSQFITGIRLARLPLEMSEIQVLVQKYLSKDGRVSYWEFCRSIESVFTTHNLEKDPLQEVKRPSRDFLNQGSNILSPTEEAQCAVILGHLQKIMTERRLLLTPFFKDFDKSLGNMGRVTKSHFSRLLHVTGLIVSEEDLHVLFKKFEDQTEGRINYMEFIRQIDPENYIGYQKATKEEPKNAPKSDLVSSVQRPGRRQSSIQELLEDIQNHVVSKRIRVAEFFRDFDKLRSYSIRAEDFSRGLFNIAFHLIESDVEKLCEHYKDPRKNGFCLWKKFATDVDRVFGESNLEKNPTHVHEREAERSPFANTGEVLDARESKILEIVLEKIRDHLRFRKASIKPFFRDCDKICSGIGHVTKSQLRQCITFMECDITEEEFNVICKKYSKKVSPQEATSEYNYINDVGKNICYILFIQDIEKGVDQEDISPVAASGTGQKVLKKKQMHLTTPGNDAAHSAFEKLMMKIKIKAKTERVRVIDFMSDFDHLRHGKISRNEFRRSIKVVFSDLTEEDLCILESYYEGPNGTVRYVDFSDAVESVFTKKGLEQNPTGKPEIFDVYSNGWETDTFINYLNPQDEEILKIVVKRMRSRINERQIDAMSFMEEYDFVKEGTITTNQFRAVLNRMELNVSDKEFAVMSQHYATNHSITRVNYRKLVEYAMSESFA